MDKLYTFNPRALWSQFRKEHFAFWMVCLYIVLQYFDPMAIHPALAIVPWDKVALVLAALSWPLDPKRRWVRDPANIWMTLFLLVIVIASAFAIYPAVSWFHWFDFVDWYIIYFLIINIVTTPERYFLVLALFLLANFKLSFFGARTWALRGFGFRNWGIMGPPGFFENSADFSGEMLMFAPIAFELALFVKPRVRRITYWFLMLGAVTGVMSILGASSRGSQVALAFQGGWMAVQRKLKLKSVLAVALLLGIGYALLPAGEKARWAVAGSDPTSVQRFDYWRGGLKMIEHHPFLGVGYFNFAPVYAVEYPSKLWHGTAQLPHNIFIQVGTDAGLIGLAVFLMLILRNLKVARDIRRMCERNVSAPAFALSVARGLTLTTWGFVVAGQFNTVSYYPFLWINLALTVSLADIVKRAAAQQATDRPVPQQSSGYEGIGATSQAARSGFPVIRQTR